MTQSLDAEEAQPEDTATPAEISFDEQRFPARPRSLRMRATRRPPARVDPEVRQGPASSVNPLYVTWLINESMLQDAKMLARQVSGQGGMWQNPFGSPDPRTAVEAAPVWFTAYPLSFVTKPGSSFLATMGDAGLWRALSEIGVRAVHIGPVKRAGGIRGWDQTASVDGHFDRISMQIDEEFGDYREFRAMTEVVGQHNAMVIDDIVPGHTGKGPDFRLAEMAYAEYPGIYHMVEIQPEDWHLLPDVRPGWDAANLDPEAEQALEKAGYIIGQLQRVIFYREGVKETNWSATSAVRGIDGIERRWVYLHYFKMGQPSINWLDPSCAGMRLVLGDAVHSLTDLGSGGLRLDANGFLGAEKSGAGGPGWSEGHPLSEAANHLVASMVRKLGGFTFQELNLSIDDIKLTAETGADLSYDFINRPAYHHALAMADTAFLRLTLRSAAEFGVDAASLVHALQNHDELTYELVHFATRHCDDVYSFRGAEITGSQLVDIVRGELIEQLTEPRAPYNLIFTTNGIACTTASMIAASLGYAALDDIDEEGAARIRAAHIMLAKFNAWQPGVFALSGWDLCGMLPLDSSQVEPLMSDGDTRWIHRPAHDLMGFAPTSAATVLPRGRSLYGTLPEQLADADSFSRQLQRVLTLRETTGIASAVQVDVPEVSQPGMLVMVHRLPDESTQMTVLNFAPHPLVGTVQSEQLVPGASAIDMETGQEVGTVDFLNSFSIELEAHGGLCLRIVAPAEEPGS